MKMDRPLASRTLAAGAACVLSLGAALRAEPVLSVEATTDVTTEPAPNIRVIPGEFTIRRRGTGDDLANALTVYLSYGGTAEPAKDFRALPRRVEFPPNETSLPLRVEAIDDEEVENDETVIMAIERATPDGTLLPYQIDFQQRSATVTIHDGVKPGELPVVGIEATRRIAEETAAPLRRLNLVGEFTVSRTGSTENAQPVWIRLSGSATPGRDYDRLPVAVRIPEGEKSVALPVTALFDQVPEGIETVVATVSACPPEGLAAPCYALEVDKARESATVFIREDGLSVASLHLTQPAPGSRFELGKAVDIEAVAIHLESYVSSVEFCADEKNIGESTIHFVRAPDPGSSITHQFEWEGAAAGTYVLMARTTLADGDGRVRLQSAPVRITVGEADPPDNLAPGAAITSPESGATLPAGQAVEITVEGQDEDGFITRVQYFANGRQIGEQSVNFITPPPPGELQIFTFRWEHPLPAIYALIARVTDNEGAGSPVTPVRVIISPPEDRAVVSVIARDALAIEPDPDGTFDAAAFFVRRHRDASGPVTVNYTLSGAAENGADYEPLSGVAVIPQGANGIDLPVIPLLDDDRERPEAVELAILPGDYAVAFPARALAVIHDASEPFSRDRAQCLPLAGRLFQLCFPAPSGHCVRLEASRNLRDWETLFCLLSVDGSVHFVDGFGPGEDRRFFRIADETVLPK